MPMIDQFAQMKIDERAAQLEAVAQKESLGLAIKHDSVATIRKVGDDLMFTPDQLAFVVGEIKKCRKDIVYFAEKYFRIIGDGGLQLIKLYPKQKELLRTMQRESRVVCLASRQVGKSTTYTIYFLWLSMFFPDRKIAIAAHQFATAEEILARIKLAYEYIPKEIKPAVVAYNNKQIHFDNNSEVRAFATGGNSLAGFSFDCIAENTKVTIEDDNGDLYYTDVSNVRGIATSSKEVNTIMIDEAAKKFHFVYKTVNVLNGKEYTGVHSTDNLDDGYLGSGTVLKKAIEKYGPENFHRSIVKMFSTRQEALDLEKNIVNEEYVSRQDTYNVTIGGGDAPRLCGEDNGFYGKKHTEETRQKMRDHWKQFYATHECCRIGQNMLDNDDVVVDGVRYNSIYDLSVKTRMWSIPKLMELLLKDGNGFVDPEKQEQLKLEYENYLSDKEQRHQHHLLANKLSHNTPEYRKATSERLKGKKHSWQDKINKDPEKIRKTAEKHRGMTRSDESKRRIAEGVRKSYERRKALGQSSHNKGKIGIVNCETGEIRYIAKNEEIPIGWKRGLRK